MDRTYQAQPSKKATYPPPYIIPPLSQPHRHTFIVLHGRGSNGSKFGEEFLAHPVDVPGYEYESFQQAFPNAEFIFPTAAFRRAKVFNRTAITQWFDNWHLEQPEEREELMIEGLRESSDFVSGLIGEAEQKVGKGNVVVSGLSQGCATMLVTMILAERQKKCFGVTTWFGMCGWLPFRNKMEEAIDVLDTEAMDESGIFEKDEASTQGIDEPDAVNEEIGQNESRWRAAHNSLCEELDLGTVGTPLLPCLDEMGLFLGHGTGDEKVPITLGREAAALFKKTNLNIVWKEYEGLGHWYSAAMLKDIIEFVKGRLLSQDLESTEAK